MANPWARKAGLGQGRDAWGGRVTTPAARRRRRERETEEKGDGGDGNLVIKLKFKIQFENFSFSPTSWPPMKNL